MNEMKMKLQNATNFHLFSEIQDVLGKMIVHLSINSISPPDLKKLFSLFKLEDMNKVK